MSQTCNAIPPDKLSAGLACRDHSGPDASEEHLEVLDFVCVVFKLHAHPGIDNGKGILLTLGQPEPRHKVPLEIEKHSEGLGLILVSCTATAWVIIHNEDHPVNDLHYLIGTVSDNDNLAMSVPSHVLHM